MSLKMFQPVPTLFQPRYRANPLAPLDVPTVPTYIPIKIIFNKRGSRGSSKGLGAFQETL